MIENEIPKYRKQKDSDTSKAKAKSKHKHHYEECLIQYKQGNIYIDLRSYCTVCGKLGDRFKKDKSIVKNYVRKIDTPIKGYILMRGDDLYEQYKDKLPVFFVEDYFSRYVNLEEDENTKGE